MPAAHNFWPGQATQAQRKQARENIILEDVGITKATLERYYTAVARLAPEIAEVSTEGELDESIASWIQDQFEDGAPPLLNWGCFEWASPLRALHSEEAAQELEALRDLEEIRNPLQGTAADAGYCPCVGRLVPLGR